MKILFLGAARHQVPAIEAALRAGHQVFTADNVPGNPGHRLAHQSFEISAVDEDAVVELAVRLEVDGVLGFASEVCARTAAHVAHRCGLPGPSPTAVETLSQKDRFRHCSAAAGLQQLLWQSFASHESERAIAWAGNMVASGKSVVVKPVDSSGGRGVSVQPGNLEEAFHRATAASRRGDVIVEEYVVRSGRQMGGDGWMEEGRLRFLHGFDNDTRPAPEDGVAIQETFPSRHAPERLAAMAAYLERLLQASGYTGGPFNFDGCFLGDGRPFVFEIAPRNGGNFIPQMIFHQTGVDLTSAAVGAALDRGHRLAVDGARRSGPPRFHGTWVLHAPRAGRLRKVTIAPELEPLVLEMIPYVMPGESVRPFTTSGDALGVLLMEFSGAEEMRAVMDKMPRWCQIDLEPHE